MENRVKRFPTDITTKFDNKIVFMLILHRCSPLALKDIKRLEENEQQEVKEKPRTVVLKEREFSERQQLVDELKSLREKLCLSERDNSRLKADLQRVKEQVKWRDQEITSLPSVCSGARPQKYCVVLEAAGPTVFKGRGAEQEDG